MTALSELLHSSKNKAPAAIKRIEDSEEHTMDRGTIYKYLKGEHPERPSEKYLKALAYGFELKITEVRTAAKVPAGELGPWTPPAEAGQLSKPVRDALDALVIVLAKEGYGSGKPAKKSLTVVPDAREEGPEVEDIAARDD